MIQFNELRYSYDMKYLIIDVSVNQDSYFDRVIIDSIIIDNQDTYNSSGPSSNAIFQRSYTSGEYKIEPYTNVYADKCHKALTKDEEECLLKDNTKQRHIRISLKIGEDIKVDTSKDILFVYVKAAGYPDPATPCGFDNSLILGTVFNLQQLYKDILCHIKELNNKCTISNDLVNSILKLQALEICVKTGNYITLIKLWKEYQFCNNNTCNYQFSNNCKCCGNN